MAPDIDEYPAYQSSRPYTRWWWLGGPFRQEDIVYQLDWLNANGFGGVELAWLDPTWQGRSGDRARPGVAQRGVVGAGRLREAVRRRDRARLRPDVRERLAVRRVAGAPEDAAQTLTGPSTQRLYGSWEAGPRLVLNHLSERALRRYAEALAPAFRPGLAGIAVGAVLRLAGAGSGRDLEPGAVGRSSRRASATAWRSGPELARTHPHMRYEYRRMVGSTMQQAFFETFARVCRELGAISRVQCHGVADRSAGRLRQRGRAGVRGAAVRAALLADRGLGGGAGRQGAGQRPRRSPASTASSGWATCGRPATGAASRSPI